MSAQVNILDKCVAMVEDRVKVTPNQRKQLNQDIVVTRNLLDNLYGFEEGSRKSVQSTLEILERKRDLADGAKAGYKRFANLDMLKWRDKNGYPRIVLFTLDSPVFSIKVKSTARREWGWDTSYIRRTTSVTTSLGAFGVEHYADVIQAMRTKSRQSHKSVSLECEYSGIIPEETRAKIKTAKKVFKDVFIMAEGTNFKMKTKAERVVNVGDPLIVGWDGKDMWLVDKFDLTSIEQLIASEFTQ